MTLEYIYFFLKRIKKDNFSAWFELPDDEKKQILEFIIKDERIIKFLNNTDKYISDFSKSVQWSYKQRRLILVNLFSSKNYNLPWKKESQCLNDLLTIIHFVLKKVNILQPLLF